jgi:hypothetical protein
MVCADGELVRDHGSTRTYTGGFLKRVGIGLYNLYQAPIIPWGSGDLFNG